jgi:hypothetical protein
MRLMPITSGLDIRDLADWIVLEQRSHALAVKKSWFEEARSMR